MQTLAQLLAELVAQGKTPEVAAKEALGTPATRDELVDLVYPSVRATAVAIHRQHVRNLEEIVFEPASNSPDQNTGRPAAVQELVVSSIPLPDGRWVTMGDMTEEDHRQRARWQFGRAKSIAKDAERHQKAADLIAATSGAFCLNDIPGWEDLI